MIEPRNFGNANLDIPPPLPPGATKKLPTMEGLTGSPDAGSPAIMGLQLLQQAKDSLIGLAGLFPTMADLLYPTVTQLEQLVAEEMANKVAGTIPGAGIPAPPPTQMGPPTGAAGPQGM